MRLYHGSPTHGIESFITDRPRYEGVEGEGVYLTTDYRVARNYAGAEGCVYEVEIKNACVFDATTPAEFNLLLEKLSKLIGYNLKTVPFMAETIEGLVAGRYRIMGREGLSWQLVNLLSSDENFLQTEDAENKIDQVRAEVLDYQSQHNLLKYLDRNLGLVYLAQDPALVKVCGEIIVGSGEDEAKL